jgi:rhamnose utilization protein RhaD (predicted bifunctional aldolase and dehydrogenase)
MHVPVYTPDVHAVSRGRSWKVVGERMAWMTYMSPGITLMLVAKDVPAKYTTSPDRKSKVDAQVNTSLL